MGGTEDKGHVAGQDGACGDFFSCTRAPDSLEPILLSLSGMAKASVSGSVGQGSLPRALSVPVVGQKWPRMTQTCTYMAGCQEDYLQRQAG